MAVNPLPAKQAATRAYTYFGLVSWVIGAKAANTINVGVTLKDHRGNALALPAKCRFYLSDNSDGHTFTATPTTSALAIGTNGSLVVLVTGVEADVVSSPTGLFDVNVIQTASPVPYYACIEMPDGSIAVSPIVQF